MSEPQETMPTVDELRSRIDAGWRQLQEALARLAPSAWEGPRSAEGWTVKDHVAHLAAWEASAVALLRGESRAAAMGVDEATFAAGFDAVNAAVQVESADQPLETVRARLTAVHEELLGLLDRMSDEDLLRSYSSYQPNAAGAHVPTPVVAWIVGNTFEHYEEHVEWIGELVEGN